MAMVPVKDLDKAKDFYSQTLGLKPTAEHQFGITYVCGGGQMFVYPTPTAGTAKSTVATWEVKDLSALVKELDGKVEFEHYDYPGAEHDGPIHILGGMKSGLSTVWLNAHGRVKPEGIEPTWTVTSLNELEQLLCKQ